MAMSDFDADTFCDWLDERDGGVPMSTLRDEWPDFPWDNLGTVTIGLSDDGESLYYQRDLRRAARGRQPRD